MIETSAAATAMTKEPQYKTQVDSYLNQGPISMGSTASHVWRTDPRRLVIMLSRYKFVSKMLVGCKDVLEVGCGDGFGSRIVSQIGAHVTCTDFDPVFIKEARERDGWDSTRSFEVIHFGQERAPKQFDAAYLLDVIEHVPAAEEHQFLANIAASVKDDGMCIIGAPSLESQAYASEWSKAGHINCKTGEDLRATVARHFKTVLMFGMNDEVVHTGFLPMCHYAFAVGVGVKR